MAGLSERHYLTPLFEPAAVAVIGATERAGAVGEVLLRNMLEAKYRGQLFAVNPKHRSVHGVPCFSAIGKAPARVDLAVIATPAASVPNLIEQCGRSGVRAAVVISAGFAEAGPTGAKLERTLLENARRHKLRLVGPNCLGLMRPALGLNASFARGAALPGALGLVAQSGAVCTAMLDWARPNGVGFSSVVSLGGSTDVDFGEIIDYLVADEATEHILLYIEGVRSARRFVSALRAAARVKPVIVQKVGRHPEASRAAVAHAGAIAGLDDVFDAVVKRAGVVRVKTIGQMVAAAQALAAHVRPQGDRLAVVTNGGGPGVMAADRAADLGIALAELAPATLEALKPALPAHWSQGNPLDLIGDAGAERYRAAVGACLADDGVDGVLAILSPQAMSEPDAAAAAVIEAARGSSKPVLACWMGDEQTAAARRRLAQAHIPVFRTPDPAVEMFGHLSAFHRNQRALLQTPGPMEAPDAPDLGAARAVVAAAREGVLPEAQTRRLLEAFAIPLASGAARHAHGRELRVGVLRDPAFGPAIVFGTGGAAAQVHGDRAVALPPLNRFLAADMIRDTPAAKLLGPYRGMPPADMAALEAILLRVSEMVCELPELAELELDPLLAHPAGALAAGARVVLRPAAPRRDRYAHMAIHPYPTQLVSNWRPADGPQVTLRPIRPEDAELEQAFVKRLSAETRYFRFMDTLRELTPQMLVRFTQIDYDREMAFVAAVREDGGEAEVGVARYVANPDGESCEFAVVIADDWQRRGLGRRMMAQLIEVARARGLRAMVGHVLAENRGMLALCQKLGFAVGDSAEGATVKRVTLALD